jgi:hypothetical protein
MWDRPDLSSIPPFLPRSNGPVFTEILLIDLPLHSTYNISVMAFCLYTASLSPYYGGFFRPDHDPPAASSS